MKIGDYYQSIFSNLNTTIKVARHALKMATKFSIFSLTRPLVYSRLQLNRWLNDPLDPDDVNKIAVVARSSHGLGDFIELTVLLDVLQSRFPDQKIFLFSDSNLPVDRICPDKFDQFQKFSDDYFSWELKELIDTHDIDVLMVDFLSMGDELLSPFLFSRSTLQAIIGHAGNLKYSICWDWLLTHPCRMIKDKHHIANYLDLAQPLGIKTDPQPPRFEQADHFRTQSRKLLSDRGLGSESFITVAPGTGSQAWKRWDREKFQTLIQRIVSEHQKTVLIIGGPEEKALQKYFDECFLNEDQIVNLIGRTDLEQVFGLVGQSDYLICNSCGLMHVADAMDTNSVVISGPIFQDSNPLRKKHLIIDTTQSDELRFDNFWIGSTPVEILSDRPGLRNTTAKEVLGKIEAKFGSGQEVSTKNLRK